MRQKGTIAPRNRKINTEGNRRTEKEVHGLNLIMVILRQRFTNVLLDIKAGKVRAKQKKVTDARTHRHSKRQKCKTKRKGGFKLDIRGVTEKLSRLGTKIQFYMEIRT